MIGGTPNLSRFNEDELPYVGVKAAMFSFKRLGGVDPILGVEMASTGEVGCIGQDFHSALLLSLEAAGIYRPKKGVLISSGSEKQKLRFLSAAKVLFELGLKLYATEGTAKFFAEHGIEVHSVAWPNQADFDVIELIRSGDVDMVINIPKNSQRTELTYGSQIRQAASRFGCSLITNVEVATAFVEALGRCRDFTNQHELLVLPHYRAASVNNTTHSDF